MLNEDGIKTEKSNKTFAVKKLKKRDFIRSWPIYCYLLVAIFIILLGIYFLTDKLPNDDLMDKNIQMSEACQKIKTYQGYTIYKKIGVPECCFEIALTVQAEGYYSGELPPECSGEVMNEIYQFCEENSSCW